MGGSAYGSYSSSSSRPAMFDPFGGMPFQLAGMLQKRLADPLSKAFGAGTPGFSALTGGANNFLPTYMPTLTSLASNITQGANSTYGGYQSAVDSFMKQLPGFQSTVAGATGGAQQAQGAAQTALSDVMSPLQSRATYQEAARRALGPAREGAAARGMLEGGEAQAGEQSLLSDLAFKTLSTDAERQQAAIQGLSGASGTVGQLGGLASQLASLGPEVQNALFSAYPQLASVLSGAAQMPMQGLGQILQFLIGGQQPSMDLLKIVAPQMGQKSKSLSLAGGASAQA